MRGSAVTDTERRPALEKVIYTLSREEYADAESFASGLVDDLPPELQRLGASKFTIAVNDADVADAEALRISNREPAIDAVVTAWANTANRHREIEALLSDFGGGVAGYLVTESVPLSCPTVTADGQRSPGMLQVAFLRIPGDVDRREWFSIWRDEHTNVAIETQSTFVYRQNLVAIVLTENAPDCAAIVEEGFPDAAMTSQHAFYDAVGDDDKLERHRRRMWESSRRFVDVATIDVLPVSEYAWGAG